MTTRLAARSPSSPNAPPAKAKPLPTSASTTPARPRPPTRKNSRGNSAYLKTNDGPPKGFERHNQSTASRWGGITVMPPGERRTKRESPRPPPGPSQRERRESAESENQAGD